MNRHKINFSNNAPLRTIASGLLLSLPIISFSAVASSALPNSFSSLSYDAPFDASSLGQPESSNFLVSQVRPIEGQLPADGERIILDEGPDGRLLLDEGTVDIKLINQTDGTIVFQLTSGDNPQTTMGIIDRTNVTLHNLDAPVDLDLVQPTGDFVQVTPEIAASNLLEVTLTEPTSSSDISLVEGTLSILEDGSIYLNDPSLN